ncbi:MAG: valine--tRNA ligase [Myxococcota bacterium]
MPNSKPPQSKQPPAELPKAYDAARIEQRWQQRWLQADLFAVRAADSLPASKPPKAPYVVLMPPPNVTGTLHNGHALFVALQDILVRTQRMRGNNALWLPGLDHAGIATQTVVERQLQIQEGKTRHDVGRKAFIGKVWQWKERNGDRIVQQLQAIGASADWSRLRFSMDPHHCEAVEHAFVQLWNDGLIYRGQRLVNWDVGSQTAISDEEVQHVPRKGQLVYFTYRLVCAPSATAAADAQHAAKDDPSSQQHRVEGQVSEGIVVATTRLETMLGDTAIAVHPHDERYKQLVGQRVQHPFFADRTLPIIADEAVKQDFGSGAVKITPAHDPADFAMGQRHGLESICVLDRHSRMNAAAGPYKGLSKQQARERIEQDLADLGLLCKKESIEHNVSVSQRSGEVIEPMISRQYFVKAGPLARQAKQAVDSGDTQIIPGSWKKTWDHFLDNIQDWCISRQLWWGHRIPVYYDLQALEQAIRNDAKQRQGQNTPALEALLAHTASHELLRIALDTLDDAQVRSFCVASTTDLTQQDPKRYVQEEDVLDTWFSSGLWPFAALGWPQKTDDLAAFYPSAVLETGFDILFFWVARMMMLGIHFMGRVPFRHVYLHAMVRDAHGKKMSKSLGNAIDPLDVMQGCSLQQLQDKTRQHPIPPSRLDSVLAGVAKNFPDGIPAVGADGLRLSLAILSGQGRDVRLSVPRVVGYRSFLNKLWNATRFALPHIHALAQTNASTASAASTSLAQLQQRGSLCDRWILSRLQRTIAAVNQAVDTYRFDEMGQTLYHFVWSQLCDWYVECAKVQLRVNSQDKQPPASAHVTAQVLQHVLEVSMRLLHPVCPFVTEELWAYVRPNTAQPSQPLFCCTADYPQPDTSCIDEQAETDMQLLQQAVTLIRATRQESGVPVSQKLPVILLTDTANNQQLLQNHTALITQLAHAQTMQVQLRGQCPLPATAHTNPSPHVDAVLLLTEANSQRQQQRLQQQFNKVSKELAAVQTALDNPRFVSGAPANVVQAKRQQCQQLQSQADKLQNCLRQFDAS